MKELARYLKKMLTWGFPGRFESKSFIVDSTNPLTPVEGVGYTFEVMQDAEGLVVVDGANKSSVDYPTEITAGYITFGDFTEISVTAGLIKVYLA